MSTTQPYTLTGRRLTAVPAVPADPLSLPAVGDVFFAVEIEPQGQPAYVSLVNRPPRHNMSNAIATVRGVWLGCTNNVHRTLLGRAQVVRHLADGERVQVRLIDETNETYARFANWAA